MEGAIGLLPPIVEEGIRPSRKLHTMSTKITKIDQALRTIRNEDEGDRKKLRKLIEQADDLSTRVRTNFQKCMIIREEMNISTGESAGLAEIKITPRKIHYCGPPDCSPESPTRRNRKRSAEKNRAPLQEPIQPPFTPNNNASFSQFEKLANFRRMKKSPEKERKLSMSVTRKPKAKRSGEAKKEDLVTKRAPKAELARTRLRANLLSIIILLVGLAIVFKLL